MDVLKRLWASRKFQVSLMATVLPFSIFILTAFGLEDTEMLRNAVHFFWVAAFFLAAIFMGTTAYEDAQSKAAGIRSLPKSELEKVGGEAIKSLLEELLDKLSNNQDGEAVG